MPYEVIVCDDGSNSMIRDLICAAHHSSRLDLRYIWQPDRGFRLARSRNNGIRCAQGEILVFVDGDSWLRPFFLREHWDAHRDGRRLVSGGYQEVELSEESVPADYAVLFDRIPPPEQVDLSGWRMWTGADRPWMACSGGNLSVRRSDAIAISFDEGFQGWGSEDRDFAFRLYGAGVMPHVLERTGLVHLRLNDQAIDWNPTKGGSHHSIVAALEGKLYLYRKYPNGEMSPSLQLVQFCHLNEITYAWEVGPPRSDISVAAILADFEAWRERQALPQNLGEL